MTDDPDFVPLAVVDALNSIGVAQGVVSWRVNRPLTRRLLDRLTGEKGRIDALFDAHASNALAGMMGLMESLRDRGKESDIVMLRMIGAVKTLRIQMAEHLAETDELRDLFIAFEREIRPELDRLRSDVDKSNAQLDIYRVFKELNQRVSGEELSLSHLWQAAVELWWGTCGVVLRRAPDGTEARAVRGVFAQCLHETLERFGGKTFFEPLPLISKIQPLPQHELETVELIALDPTWRTRPITRAIIQRRAGAPDIIQEQLRIPVITSADGLSARILSEMERSTLPP